MPLLGYIFHFPAIVFHYFYEKCFQSYVKLTPWMHKIIKIYWKNEYILKTDQSDSKSTLIYLKWFQSDPKVCKMAPKWRQMTPKPPRIAQPFVLLASSPPSWHLKMSGKWIYSVYGPVWVGHEAIWYALHVPFDVYMPLLASLSSLSAHFLPLFWQKLLPKWLQTKLIVA